MMLFDIIVVILESSYGRLIIGITDIVMLAFFKVGFVVTIGKPAPGLIKSKTTNRMLC